MKKAVAAIYAAQKDDNWEVVTKPTNAPDGVSGLQWTGPTAISTYALLCAGAQETDKPVSAAIDFLVANPSRGVYASAARCLVWSRLKLTPALRVAAQKDVDFLLKAVKSKGEARGLFFYGLPSGPDDATYDHSASQMAALGLSVMPAEGFEIPQEFWRLTEQAWQRHQFPDGSWKYIRAHGKTCFDDRSRCGNPFSHAGFSANQRGVQAERGRSAHREGHQLARRQF